MSNYSLSLHSFFKNFENLWRHTAFSFGCCSKRGGGGVEHGQSDAAILIEVWIPISIVPSAAIKGDYLCYFVFLFESESVWIIAVSVVIHTLINNASVNQPYVLDVAETLISHYNDTVAACDCNRQQVCCQETLKKITWRWRVSFYSPPPPFQNEVKTLLRTN
jgi:hypothetical protein